MNHPKDSQGNEYLVHHQEQVQGPFGVDSIEAMILTKVYPPWVMVQKTGTSSWVPFTHIVTSSRQTETLTPPPLVGKVAIGFSPKPTDPLLAPSLPQPKHPTGSKNTKPETVVAQIVVKDAKAQALSNPAPGSAVGLVLVALGVIVVIWLLIRS